MTRNLSRAAPVAVTGASGYIGGRLVPRLLAAGYRVRCLVREPRKVASRSWAAHPDVEIVACDLNDPDGTVAALRGCGPAFYLVHSMLSAGARYAEADRCLAANFARAALLAGVPRILYLGGLGETGPGLSRHLTSRREVETALSGLVPVTTLRAAMIIGAGSASFEILRYLVERLPVMITPRWVKTECQPIAVGDVLTYLLACLERPETIGRTFDIGGPDVVTYLDLIQLMARARGLPKRVVLPVPVLTPRLSSLWLHLVTPVPLRIARPLAEGLRNRVVCRDRLAQEVMPQPLLPVAEAVAVALGSQQAGRVETRWSDAGVVPGDPDWAGGTTFEDVREVEVAAPIGAVYRAVCRVGGGHGWYAADWLWRLRGAIDKFVGGPGLRRGRRDPESVSYGEALDFWRATAVDPPHRLSLQAEMRLPGSASLTFELQASGARTTCLRQCARFQPRGLLGLLYWYSVLPLHAIVFAGMLGGIRRAAEEESRQASTAADDSASAHRASRPRGMTPARGGPRP
ncbi:MAG: SDR family oxidoreductase [Planctomycetota bacterium]